MKNYYEILGINFDATQEEIKRAYRLMAKKYHPDISKTDTKYFNLITEAYKILSDPYERLLYNYDFFKVSKLPEKPQRKFKVIYSRSLSVLAKRGFLRPFLSRAVRRKVDIEYDIILVIDDTSAIKETHFMVDVPTKILCPACARTDTYCRLCSGKGYIIRPQKIRVDIPDGIKNNEIFEIDLSKIKQKNLMTIRAQKLRIKVCIGGSA